MELQHEAADEKEREKTGDGLGKKKIVLCLQMVL